MKVVIVGRNRVEVCEVKKRDFDKMFFAHRSQLYQVLPSNLIRLRTYGEDGREDRDTEEVCFFREGADVAYDTLDEDAYYQEAVLPSIDLYRDVKRAKFKAAGILQTASSMFRGFYPFIGVLVLVAVLGYAFLNGGRRGDLNG